MENMRKKEILSVTWTIITTDSVKEKQRYGNKETRIFPP